MSASLEKSRRRLPHWHREGAIYWITFRMSDSLPREKLKKWKAERDAWMECHPKPWDPEVWRDYDERFGGRLEKWLDAGMGSCALRRPEIRDCAVGAFTKFDGDRYHVHAAVIMPNHVHMLLEPFAGQSLSLILKGMKGASARAINRKLGKTGTFWMEESYDHIVRSERQYQHFRGYIRENPVKAGLKPSEYWLVLGGGGG